MALHFEQVSLASLPANLLAAPVVAPIMWLGMVAIAVAQVAPGLAAPLNCSARRCSATSSGSRTRRRARRSPRSPSGSAARSGWSPPTPRWVPRRSRCTAPGRAIGGVGAGPARAAPARGRRSRAARAASRSARCQLARRGRARPAPPAPGELVVSFLDVGQGDATLLQRDGATVLVDTGPPDGPILRRLDEAGVGRLDLLVLTHAEADHEGMALAVIAAHRPRLVLDGGAGWPTAVQRGLAAALARTGGRRSPRTRARTSALGALRLRVLWPPAPPPGWRPGGNPNDRAVVAHVQAGAFDLLLPADAESERHGGAGPAGRRGAQGRPPRQRRSGPAATLEQTTPAVAAIEVGASNTYGHPTPSTLGALRVVPRVVRTDRDGTVRLRVAGGRMTLDPAGAGA